MDRVVDTGMREYYDARADEYDEWWHDAGLWMRRVRPGWDDEVALLIDCLTALGPARVLDVACGTAFLTRHLPGEVTAIDQSPRMVAVAAARMPHARVIQGEAVPLPFADGEFDRVTTAHFYGHLLPGERETFVAEALRVCRELIVIDTGRYDPDLPAERWQERVLNDGSAHRVYKRYFTADGLAAELGGGEVLFDGRWFVVVRITA
jgi:SAM-dependent methyltransferase